MASWSGLGFRHLGGNAGLLVGREGDLLLDLAEFGLRLGGRCILGARSACGQRQQRHASSSSRMVHGARLAGPGGENAAFDSGAVIGMIEHNGDRAVKLFQQHDAHQPVRPGHRAEDRSWPLLAQVWGMAIRPADKEDEFGCRLSMCRRSSLAKASARKRLAALIEDDADGPLRDGAIEQGCFLLLAQCRAGCLAFGELLHLDGE